MIVAGLALAGCDDLALGGARPEPITLMAPDSFAYFVATPDRYCIDRAVSREGQDFYVMAGCALVSNLEVMPFRDGLITVQFGADQTAAITGAETDMRALLSTAEGVALLSSSGNPGAITVDALETGDNLVIVHFTDTAPPLFDGLEQSEWRAFLDIGGRLTTVTVRGFARAPMTRNDGQALLLQAVGVLVEANRPAQMAAILAARQN